MENHPDERGGIRRRARLVPVLPDTPAEYSGWLGDLGFQDIRTVWFEAAGANGAVIGRKL